MRFTRLQKEIMAIYIVMLIASFVLMSLGGCGALTTKDSCTSSIESVRLECIERVELRQNRIQDLIEPREGL